MTPRHTNHPTPPGKPPAGQRPGFTLIELLVVIVIIGLLVGLVVGASAWWSSSRRSLTRVTLGQLKGVATEYEAQVGANVRYDITSNDPSMTHFLDQVWQIEVTHPMIDSIPDKLRKHFDGKHPGDGSPKPEMVFDPWENPIVYRYYRDEAGHRPQDESSSHAMESPLETENLPERRRPFFASAGPDGEFGTDDDIYSFEVD
jgi:prepilin-type N-terminal cleavage/methylation domain-containing protein